MEAYKKEFIEFLKELRKFQCESGFDVDNIADQIVHSSNTWLEILQNINDARNEIKNDPNDPIEVKINKKEGFIELLLCTNHKIDNRPMKML